MSMELKRRVGLPSMRFHVMNRGARKVDIFSTDDDRQLFVSLMAKYALKYEIRLVAWCLMTNHYHLKCEGEGTPLTRMMHDLDGTYARVFNQRYGMPGALYQGRFKSMAILDDDGLAYISRYIHANPLALSIPPEEYRWSSARAYLGLSPTPDWLDPTPVLGLMGPEGADLTARYAAYLEAAPPPRAKNAEGVDDRQEFYQEYVRYLESRCMDAIERVGGDLRLVAPRTIVSWIASRRYGIPASTLARIHGRREAASTRTLVSRFGRQLASDPALQACVDRVYEIVARFR